jgi:hypothetical protein
MIGASTFRLSPGTTAVNYTDGKSSSVHWMGGCVDAKESLDTVEKRKISSPTGNRNPAVQ